MSEPIHIKGKRTVSKTFDPNAGRITIASKQLKPGSKVVVDANITEEEKA